MKSRALIFFLFLLVGMASVHALQGFDAAFADTTPGLTISGGTEGTDYTYEDGVLRITKPGTYSIGMASGVSSTTDRIVVVPPDGASGQTYDLTFNNLNLTNETEHCFFILNQENQRYKINITLNGDNSFSTEQSVSYEQSPFKSNLRFGEMNISGPGTLILTGRKPGSAGNGKGVFEVDSLTLHSGNIICRNDHISSNFFTVRGGTVDVSGDFRGIYCVCQFVMRGGDVTLNTQRYGIQVTGDGPGHQQPEDGVVIEKGKLDITADGDMSYGIMLTGTGTNPVVKNIVISSPDGVTINCPTRGAGIGVPNPIARPWLYMNGGELEITTNGNGSSAFSNMNLQFASDYTHKNYAGDSAASREVKPDYTTPRQNQAGMILKDGDRMNCYSSSRQSK